MTQRYSDYRLRWSVEKRGRVGEIERERRVKIRREEGNGWEEWGTVFRYAHVKRRTFKEIP